jgi:hypothetical protein
MRSGRYQLKLAVLFGADGRLIFTHTILDSSGHLFRGI